MIMSSPIYQLILPSTTKYYKPKVDDFFKTFISYHGIIISKKPILKESRKDYKIIFPLVTNPIKKTAAITAMENKFNII